MVESIVGKKLNKGEWAEFYVMLIGDDLWNEYLSRRKNLIAALRENQEFCDKLDALITDKLKASSKKGEK